jgi:hypothetical protein
MERDVASQLIQLCLRMHDELGKADALAEQMDEVAKRSYRKAIGNLIQEIYIELMRPIIRQYPDLDPDPRT